MGLALMTATVDWGATLQAYRILVNQPRNYNLLWVCTAEEEVSGEDGFSFMLPMLPPINVAIVGEPAEMQPATTEKGLMVIDSYAHRKLSCSYSTDEFIRISEICEALCESADRIGFILKLCKNEIILYKFNKN